jgi:hypothetical protein
MKSPALGMRVAAVDFGLMSLFQFTRLIINPQVLNAGHIIHRWPSAIAFLVFGGLSLWMWKLSRTTPS